MVNQVTYNIRPTLSLTAIAGTTMRRNGGSSLSYVLLALTAVIFIPSAIAAPATVSRFQASLCATFLLGFCANSVFARHEARQGSTGFGVVPRLSRWYHWLHHRRKSMQR